ncbi:hypothetical protein EDB89DRAFT_1900588 [Lactarius sanguifluus]|nr:hypothetical protein EDB89DRAFT_1900588 [Lactarius sanguifluus]
MASLRLTIPENNNRTPAERMAWEPTTNDNGMTRRTRQTPRSQHGQRIPFARSPTTNNNRTPAERMAREPTTDDDDADLERDLQIITALLQRRWQLQTRHHETNLRPDTTRADNGGYQSSTSQLTTKSTNAGRNRYAALNSEATCDDVLGFTATNDWTTVTRKRKRNADPRRQRGNKDVTTISQRPETTAPTDISKDRKRLVNARPDLSITERQSSTVEVEAHIDQSTRGDAHPFPIPSPNPGVTPLTRRLDAQSDVSGVACTRSPRMVQLLRWIREATDVGITPHTPLDPNAPSNKQQAQPETAETESGPTKEDACLSTPTRNTEGAPHEDDEGEDEEMNPPHRTTMNDAEGHNLPDDEQSSRQVHLRHPVDPGRWTREDEGDVSVEPTPDDLGEDDPIAAIDTITDEERGELQEILSPDNTPLTKTDLGKILTQIRRHRNRDSPTACEVKMRPAINSSDNDGRNDRPEVCEEETNLTVTTDLVHTLGSVQLFSAQTDKTLAPDDTLDDEELWDAFTRDDREDMLSRLLGDGDGDDDIPRRSDARYGPAYGPDELEDPDKPLNAEDTLSDPYNGLTDRTCKPRYLDDEEEKRPSESDDDDGVSDFDEGERDDAQSLKDEERNKYEISLQWVYSDNLAVYPQHEDDKSCDHKEDNKQDDEQLLGDDDDSKATSIDGEAQHDALPFIDEGHDKGESRGKREKELRVLEELKNASRQHRSSGMISKKTCGATLPATRMDNKPTEDSDEGDEDWTYGPNDPDDECDGRLPRENNEEGSELRNNFGYALTDNRQENCPGDKTQTSASRGLIIDETAVPPTLIKQGTDPPLPPLLTRTVRRGRSSTKDVPVPSPFLHPCQTFLTALIRAAQLIQDARHFSRTEVEVADLPVREIHHCKRALGEGLGRRLWEGNIPSQRFLPSSQSVGNLYDNRASVDAFATVPSVRFSQGFYLGCIDLPVIDTTAFRASVADSNPQANNPGAADTLHTYSADNFGTCQHDDARASRPMTRPANHGHVWPRTVPTLRPVALTDIQSCTLGGRYGKTPSYDPGLCPATGINHVLPRLVIMEDDSLRRGVISRLSRFSPIPPVSLTPNDLANASIVGEMTVLQNYLQSTQPTKHDDERNWEDTRRLKEIQTTGTRIDADNDGEYNGSATPHSIARQDNDVKYLDRLQLQLQKAMKTLESYHPTSSIPIARYSEETDTDLNPMLEFYTPELRKKKDSTVRRNDNTPCTHNTYTSSPRERLLVPC